MNGLEITNNREPALLEDRPEASYIPTHREGMQMIGMGMADDLMVGLMYSYAHRFWVLENDGGEYVTNRIDIQRDDAIHLMATPFHRSTGTVVPDTGLSVEIARDGSLVSQETIYPMLSQRMGFHYGANVPLDGDGAYDVTVSVGGTDINRFGEFEGLFSDAANATIEFEYSEATRNEIPYTLLEDEAGTESALEPMNMEMMPNGSAPDPLPGQRLGEAMSGDARFVVHQLSENRFAGVETAGTEQTPSGGNQTEMQDGEAEPPTYIAVSAQTPHNRLVIPRMGIDMTITSTGHGEERTLYDGALEPGLDPELGFHYGGVVDHLHAGDEIVLSVTTVPQVARHEGYETAFMNMDDMTVTVPDS